LGRSFASFILRNGGTPNGKMKSREGTVVDADELMEEMYLTAKEKARN
jgi:arginyl-tRNA synthetase